MSNPSPETPPGPPSPDAPRPGVEAPLQAPRPVAPGPGDEVARELRRLSRRGFAWASAAVTAGVAGRAWLVSRSTDGQALWPLRRVFEFNEGLARAASASWRLAPEFPASRAVMPRVNGSEGMTGPGGGVPAVDAASWRIRVIGAAGESIERVLSLADLDGLHRRDQTTELKCIEGWSAVVRWSGFRLGHLAAMTGLASRSGRPYDPGSPPDDLMRYASLSTPDGGYYVGLEMAAALHRQTLLCDAMDGAPLQPDHGAPLRLVIPVKYGIKSIKRVGTIRFTDRRPADFWAEYGYDWHSGH